jgi:predicted amidohydrolase
VARIALLQLEARPGAVQDTRATIEDALVRAGAEGAALLVAPELATTGYGAGDALEALAETTGGPLLAGLAATVERTGVALVAGFAERAGDGIFNAAAALVPGARRWSTARSSFTATTSGGTSAPARRPPSRSASPV